MTRRRGKSNGPDSDFIEAAAPADGNDSGGGDTRTRASGTSGADSTASTGGDADSDNWPGQHPGFGGHDGQDSEAGDFAFTVPGGTIDAARQGDPTRSGRGTRASGRSNTRANKGRAATAENKGNVSQAVPRDVKLGELGTQRGRSNAQDAELLREFVQEGWSIAFKGLSLFFNDSDWEIDTDDAESLADRTQRWLASLDKKRYQSIEKKIAKIQPTIGLLTAVGTVVGVRVVNMRRKKRGLAISSASKVEGSPRASGGNSPGNAPRTAPIAAIPLDVHGPGPTPATGPVETSQATGNSENSQGFGTMDGVATVGQPKGNERPLSRVEAAFLFDRDDSRPM